MQPLILALILWLNTHGFTGCTGQPDVRRGSSAITRDYMAWYQDGVIALSERFDYDGLFREVSEQRTKLARSALLHEFVHFCQNQRDGAINPRSERAWMRREDEAYALQTIYLRENGSSTVLLWRRNSEG